MKPTDRGSAISDEAGRDHERSIQGLHGVRYQSSDVQRAAEFYTKYLGFTLEQQQFETAEGYRGERRQLLLFQREAEVFRVELRGALDI